MVNAVAGNRTSTPGAVIEREPRLLLVGGVKQVPCLLPASSSRGGSHFNVGDACVGVCAICDGEISRKFQVSSKKGNTLGQPNPVQKFGKKGQDGAVQNCCPIFGDPKVTF